MEPLPSIADVAKKIPTRTRTRGGGLAFTFNESTAPVTGEVVQQFITSSSDTVYGKTGPITDPDMIGDAREAIALYTAMQVELGLFPEQVRANLSPYPELKKLYDEAIASLIEAAGGSGMASSDERGGTLRAQFDFPPSSIGDGILP